MSYSDFIARKRVVFSPVGISDVPPLNPTMFPFQADITRWALRRGRAAIWADCGLGKSLMALDWSRVVTEHTGRRVLILTPLAVAQQFVREGEKFGIQVTNARDASQLRDGINVTNYERLHHFNPTEFAGVVADESSVLKDYTSSTRNALIEAFSSTPFRLACTATPAPNDQMELGNHAEFLGAMSRTEMLASFFCHDGGETQVWRLKGHAERDFWRWVASWAVSIRKPSDLGYPDDGYVLPPLNVTEHVIESKEDLSRAAGMLIAYEANTLNEQRAARRNSLADRVAKCAELVNGNDEPWCVWCDLNDESAALSAAIPGAVEVKGSDSAEHKEQTAADFASGKVRVIVSKPSIFGWGVNWQHCAHVAFVGLSHSFEQWYQAVRRNYRFGQKRAVECHVITSSAEGRVVGNLKRKQADAERMAIGMIEHMAEITKAEIRATARTEVAYNPRVRMNVPSWLRSEA